MLELTRTATFTTKAHDDSLTTIVARSVLEAALKEDEAAQLWFEIGRDDEENARLAIDLSTSDIEEMLRLSGSDDVLLTLDGEGVAGLFDDADVEAHGLKGALAIGIASAAILAPAGQAALTPQSVNPAATVQRANVAATAQVSSLAARTQVSNPARSRAQSSSAQSKVQVSKTYVLKASGFRIIGLAR